MEYEKQFTFLKGKFEYGNLGHAYLFSGPDEVGKNLFAKDFVKLISKVIARSDIAIELISKVIARSDIAIEKEQFPDLLIVQSINSKSSIENEKDMMEISVEQVREVQNFLSFKSYYGGYKAVIIHNAERMTLEAQNCFLKSLEEPKGQTLIILISSNAQMLLPTIFSRCQEIKFISAYNNQLSVQENTAMKGIQRVVNADLAEKFIFAKQADLTGNNFKNMLELLQKYFRNLMLYNIGVIEKFPVVEGKTFTTGQVKKIIRLIETINFQTTVTNANPKLALEVLLMEI